METADKEPFAKTKRETAALRRLIAFDINRFPGERESLENKHGQVWDTEQLAADFDVIVFSAPFVLVKRRSDNVCGTLAFQHHPRYYFEFEKA